MAEEEIRLRPTTSLSPLLRNLALRRPLLARLLLLLVRSRPHFAPPPGLARGAAPLAVRAPGPSPGAAVPVLRAAQRVQQPALRVQERDRGGRDPQPDAGGPAGPGPPRRRARQLPEVPGPEREGDAARGLGERGGASEDWEVSGNCRISVGAEMERSLCRLLTVLISLTSEDPIFITISLLSLC